MKLGVQILSKSPVCPLKTASLPVVRLIMKVPHFRYIFRPTKKFSKWFPVLPKRLSNRKQDDIYFSGLHFWWIFTKQFKEKFQKKVKKIKLFTKLKQFFLNFQFFFWHFRKHVVFKFSRFFFSSTGGQVQDGPEIFFLQKWTGHNRARRATLFWCFLGRARFFLACSIFINF